MQLKLNECDPTGLVTFPDPGILFDRNEYGCCGNERLPNCVRGVSLSSQAIVKST